MSDRPEDPDLQALRRAARVAPERPASEVVTLRQGRDLSPDRAEDVEDDDDRDLDDEAASAELDVESAEDTTLEDWETAEDSRPDLPDETADGLSDLEEEVRRQAEDPVPHRRDD